MSTQSIYRTNLDTATADYAAATGNRNSAAYRFAVGLSQGTARDAKGWVEAPRTNPAQVAALALTLRDVGMDRSKAWDQMTAAAKIVANIPQSVFDTTTVTVDIADILRKLRTADSNGEMTAARRKTLGKALRTVSTAEEAADLISKALTKAKADKADKADKSDNSDDQGDDQGDQENPAPRDQDTLTADAIAILARLDSEHVFQVVTYLANRQAEESNETALAS